jgi:hypothetical protein
MPNGTKSRIGRPRLGDERMELTLPKGIVDQLRRFENQTGKYRTRIAANILTGVLKDPEATQRFLRF